MKLIVQKFGGSSISNFDNIVNVAKIITSTYNDDTNVVVVVSAQGNMTNKLIKKMKKINPNPPDRELDVLLSVGEQISISLLASYINSLGYPVVSLTGWQAGIYTDDIHKNARIKYINNARILSELIKHNIVIIAGFQGINVNNDITTLGRGGSDTSAVALAVSLKANFCQIFTDVDGVYTADPKIVKRAKKINEITFDEMLELSSSGAKVLHNRSVELAKKYNLALDVISSFSSLPGTSVKEVVALERNPVRSITSDDNILLVYMARKLNKIYELMTDLEQSNIIISGVSFDTIYNQDDFCFIISNNNKYDVLKIFKDKDIIFKKDISKISIVGTGLMSNNYILSKLFKVLNSKALKPYLILTGEINISIVVDKCDSVDIINALHEEYDLGN